MRRPLRKFAHKLALAMGELDVDRVLRLGTRKLMEWQAYDLIDPFGQDREDYRMGMVVAALLNPHRKKGAKAFTPGDFMPKWGERFIELSPAELATKINRAFGFVSATFKE